MGFSPQRSRMALRHCGAKTQHFEFEILAAVFGGSSPWMFHSGFPLNPCRTHSAQSREVRIPPSEFWAVPKCLLSANNLYLTLYLYDLRLNYEISGYRVVFLVCSDLPFQFSSGPGCGSAPQFDPASCPGRGIWVRHCCDQSNSCLLEGKGLHFSAKYVYPVLRTENEPITAAKIPNISLK